MNIGLVCVHGRRKAVPRAVRTPCEKKFVASDGAWRKNVPRHILYFIWKGNMGNGRKEKHYDLCGVKKTGG